MRSGTSDEGERKRRGPRSVDVVLAGARDEERRPLLVLDGGRKKKRRK